MTEPVSSELRIDPAEVPRDLVAARPSEDPYRSLVERVREIAIFMLDPLGHVRSWNVGAAQLTGYRRAEILGRHVAALYAAEGRDRAGPAQPWTGGAGGTRFEDEVWLRRKDGSRFWADVTFSAIPGDDGATAGYAVIARDRSARKEVDEARQRLTAILEGTTDFVSFADRDGRVLFVNQAGRAMTGIAPHEDVGPLVIPDMHPAWASEIVLAQGIPAASEHGSWAGETALRSRDGREIPVHQVILAHRTDEGEIAFISTIARDITERKRAEEKQTLLLEASRRLAGSLDYQETLQQLSEMVVPRLADWCMITTLEDEQIHCVAARHREPAADRRLAELLLDRRFPLDRAAAVGPHRVLSSTEPELVSSVSDAWLEEAMRDPEHREAADELAPRSMLIVPFVARDQTIGAMTFAYSTSDRRYERPELEFAVDLAARAALALDNARLYQAQQAAVTVRDEVLSIVAHDLRNPLGRITMGAGLLLELSPERADVERRQIEILLRAADGMNRLIQDLLEVTRIEGGRGLSLERERHDVASLLDAACEMVQPLVAGKELRLECPRPAEDLVVFADRDRFLQAMGNLLGNAVKFTDRGSIMVRAERTGEGVRISVADTGPGIDEENRAHLFERFWQARQARRGGAGLGLAITKGIVEAHGGRIWVESEVGRGTTFHLTLPAG
jgi:PAS domain S-box-containing protein